MNYYLILTNKVFESNVSSRAKLLFALISGLTGEKGFSYSSNSYLAERMMTTERTITNLLKELEENELIYIEYTNNQRKIYLELTAMTGKQKIAKIDRQIIETRKEHLKNNKIN